ncbi:MAG: Crp/Fnr family transcriptional regulator [Candidatus Methylomirabilales bacterium]
MKDLATQLSEVVIFHGLDKGQLESILSISSMQQFDRGSVIFTEGEQGEELFLIIKGKVRISRQLSGVGVGEEALAVLEPTQAFGEMAVIEDDVVRSASATAHEPCSMLVLKKKGFQRLLRDNHDLAYTVLSNVVKLLSSRLRTTNDKVILALASGQF